MDRGVEFKITIAMQAMISISGVIGNSLVLCVFSRIKHKRSATVFILTLAATDFITCLITIPFTIIYEVLEYQLNFDTICKLYHFLITSAVPFSAFIMVAIAVDRYMTICHPFLQVMTIKRARIIVGILACLAVTLGTLCSVQFGVYYLLPKSTPVHYNDSGHSSFLANLQSQIPDDFATDARKSAYNNDDKLSNFDSDSTTLRPGAVGDIVVTWTGRCMYNELVFSREFLLYFQKMYASCFGVCGVMVIIIYSLIFRSVALWRRQGLRVDKRTRDLEEMEQTIVSNASDDLGLEEIEIVEMNERKTEKDELCVNSNSFSKSNSQIRSSPRNISRVKLEKQRMANVKTAFMLFVVAKVFIIAFLPAWLMALRVIPLSTVGFYMYFVYHAANPVIYAFARKSFRRRLKELCMCH